MYITLKLLYSLLVSLPYPIIVMHGHGLFLNLPLSFADCLEVWEPQPPGSLWACSGFYSDYFVFTLDIRRGRWCPALNPIFTALF